MDDKSIQDSISALLRVLNVHENHLFPRDRGAFELALSRLVKMKEQGYK